MSKAVLFFADGTEECEALLVVDLLRRAKVEVIVAGTPHSGGCCYHYADKYALYSHVVMIYEMLVHRGFHLGMVWDRERALLVCHLP